MNTQTTPTTAKPTPGPWITSTGRVPGLGRALGILKASHKPGEKGESICVVCKEDNTQPHDIANADLIAAAPDLLDVVERFATSGWLAGVAAEVDSNDPVSALLARAHAALGKARGLSQQNVQCPPTGDKEGRLK